MEFPIQGKTTERLKDGLVVQLVTISGAEQVKPHFETIDVSLKLIIKDDQLREIFRDGKLLIDDSFSEIRLRLKNSLK